MDQVKVGAKDRATAEVWVVKKARVAVKTKALAEARDVAKV